MRKTWIRFLGNCDKSILESLFCEYWRKWRLYCGEGHSQFWIL